MLGLDWLGWLVGGYTLTTKQTTIVAHCIQDLGVWRFLSSGMGRDVWF